MKLRWIWNSFWCIFARHRKGRQPIQDEDRLYRRMIFADPWTQCDPTGQPTSAAFSLREGEKGLSVDLERLTTPAVSVKDKKAYRLCALRAGAVRQLFLTCWHDPLPENRAHAQISTTENAPEGCKVHEFVGKASFEKKALRRALKEAAEVVPV